MGNKIYFSDVSIPFNLDSTLPIVDLSNDARYIHLHSYGVSTICSPNKDMILLVYRVLDLFNFPLISSCFLQSYGEDNVVDGNNNNNNNDNNNVVEESTIKMFISTNSIEKEQQSTDLVINEQSSF
ncbi:hypothetical protein RhiirA5_441567 [Rhizophagus irregularis]|uniref:Uncharacterized protein n=1 Tax=Rhizophagus irregularis TaxID=588596 RepID=A0A2N0NFI2_9GLOM|nr:hypothetical protein RhiirA5_441567 [Rhizophagus irregularis]